MNASAQCWATRLALSGPICARPGSSCATRTGDRPAQSGRSAIVGPAFHFVEQYIVNEKAGLGAERPIRVSVFRLLAGVDSHAGEIVPSVVDVTAAGWSVVTVRPASTAGSLNDCPSGARSTTLSISGCCETTANKRGRRRSWPSSCPQPAPRPGSLTSDRSPPPAQRAASVGRQAPDRGLRGRRLDVRACRALQRAPQHRPRHAPPRWIRPHHQGEACSPQRRTEDRGTTPVCQRDDSTRADGAVRSE